MSPERQKQIASEGGRAAHKLGVAHEWNSEEARKAGKKGGQIVSQNREHMSEIGRRGGQSSGGRRSKQAKTIIAKAAKNDLVLMVAFHLYVPQAGRF